MTFTGGIDEAALVDLYAGAGAVVFPPYDEDYGYITLEAFLARKPVVTTTDAGGPLEFVDDGVTGLVAAPDADSLGAPMSRVAARRGARAIARRRRLRTRPRHLLGRRHRPPGRGRQPVIEHGVDRRPRLQRERVDRAARVRPAARRRLARDHRRRRRIERRHGRAGGRTPARASSGIPTTKATARR